MTPVPAFPVQGPILPKGAASLRSLTATMAVMCHLACLAAGALFLVNRAVGSWTDGLAASATVQIAEAPDRDIDADVAAALAVWAGKPAWHHRTHSTRQSAALLEPWLGRDGLDLLPVPRVIALVLDPGVEIDVVALGEKLIAVAPTAMVDNHQQWSDALSHMAIALSFLAVAILVLIAVSAMAMVVFATRAVLDANRTTVDVFAMWLAQRTASLRGPSTSCFCARSGRGCDGRGLGLRDILRPVTPQPARRGATGRCGNKPNRRWWLGAGFGPHRIVDCALWHLQGLALVTSRLTLLRMLERLT